MTLACNGIRIAASGCNALCWSMYLLDPTRNLLLRRGYIRQMREMPLRINLRRMFRESRDSFATLAVHRVNGHPRGKGGTRSTPSPHLVLDVRVRHPDWGYIRPAAKPPVDSSEGDDGVARFFDCSLQLDDVSTLPSSCEKLNAAMRFTKRTAAFE
eukprot:CAMPEP_0195611446 /NCGR_PEP_ID=MMETSP0815-20121206/10344_1 /TAXON_ID=97485 /ORGANISM="Prymnesium parvum, Strain Texoma1" /LENGTH=155 /DNA_ID=CAMNT_0040751497 /DNA_START=721 /DNA_END=1189 /DNA_ORIENTATION=-